MVMSLLQRDTSLEGVLDLLREKIIDGSFSPGMQLKQSVLASQLGVSISPVREALIRLVEEGLVENSPYRGMFVRRFNPSDVEEIYQLRLALEFLAIQLTLPKLQVPAALEKADRLMCQIQEAEEAQDFEQATLADLNFHRYLVELSGNTRLIKFWDSIFVQSRYVLRHLYDVQTRLTGKAVEFGDHSVILKAVATGDQQQIYRALAAHMDYAVSTLKQMWPTMT